jgi:DNA repair exonuclease SbcCD ATPase subunit
MEARMRRCSQELSPAELFEALAAQSPEDLDPEFCRYVSKYLKAYTSSELSEFVRAVIGRLAESQADTGDQVERVQAEALASARRVERLQQHLDEAAARHRDEVERLTQELAFSRKAEAELEAKLAAGEREQCEVLSRELATARRANTVLQRTVDDLREQLAAATDTAAPQADPEVDVRLVTFLEVHGPATLAQLRQHFDCGHRRLLAALARQETLGRIHCRADRYTLAQ